MDQDKKDEELYKAALQSFFINEIESDKIILALSVGAIGFYTSILMKTMKLSEVMFISMIGALLFYGITIGILLFVFSRNKKQLLNIIANSGKGQEDSLLDFLDKAKYWSFAIAVIASVIFVLSLMFKNIESDKAKVIENKNINKEVKMSDKKVEILNNVPGMDGFSGLSIANEGFSEITNANGGNTQTVEKGFSNVITANGSSTNTTTTTTTTTSSENNNTTESGE